MTIESAGVAVTSTIGDIVVIRLNQPPVNALGHALRSHVAQAIERAEKDPGVHAIVLAGSDRAFSAGADVSEFGNPLQLAEPMLRTLIARIEQCRKPVVAAISGVALGGGLELAMACHGRVALASASLGLPEISLGLIPGSGGSQRLPRLAGLDTALEMMLGGQARTALELVDTGLLDKVVASASELDEEATRLARELATTARFPTARARHIAKEEVAAAVERARSALTSRQKLQPAYAALLEAVLAVALPIEEGLGRERALFLELVASPAAQALRYQFKAEREASRLPAALQAEALPVNRVAVIGAGTMGAGIAICALDAGLEVLLLEQGDEALQRGVGRVANHYAGRVAAGKETAQCAAVKQGRLEGTTDWSRLKSADVVIEAVFEDLAVKQDVFRRVDAHAGPGAILATNTSYLDIDAIAAATSRPQAVVGLHFFSPANVMKLLEVVRGTQTSAAALATGMALGRTLKKLPVPCGNAFGFIGNRIYNAYRRECEFMLEDGAYPEEIDDALTRFGFAMGPFAVADLSGLDIAWRMRKARAAMRDPRERYVAILDQLCEAGRLGRKTGAGYYTYVEGQQVRTTDAHVRQVIERARAERGQTRNPLSQPEIQRRALLAMVNEAALLMLEGVADRPSDVDVVMVQGYGFPRWEGGPVHWARNQDRSLLDADLDALAMNAGHGFVRASLDPLTTT